MKEFLRKICWPILRFFESNERVVGYKKSHRVALIVVGCLFLVLSTGAGLTASYVDDIGFIVPVVVFACIGFVSLVVGSLGSEAAVSKIWGSRS